MLHSLLERLNQEVFDITASDSKLITNGDYLCKICVLVLLGVQLGSGDLVHLLV